MKPRSSRLILAGVVVLLTGAAWLFLGNPSPTSQRLAAGSTVSLLDVSYGRNHVLVIGPIWHRVLGRLLPQKAARRLGIHLISVTTTNDALVVWTELRDFAGPANQMVPAPLTISDGRGTEIFEHSPLTHWSTTNRLVQGTVFSVVPRGSNRLCVRVGSFNAVDRARQTLLFHTPNPTPRLRPAWQASPFPIEPQAGDLKFVLTGLRPLHRQEGRFAETDAETWMAASCHFSEMGSVSTNWRVANVEVFDEAGGRHEPDSHSYSTGAELTRKEVEFRGGLGTNAVWKLRLTLAKTGGFSSNEVVSLDRLPIPAADSGSSRPISVDIEGVKLSIHTEFFNMNHPRLAAYLSVPDANVQLVALRLVDQSGANIRFSPYGNQFNGSFFWSLPPRPEGERRNIMLPETDFMDATLALSRLRYVELLVRPEPPFK
jgi:hypothetical protein